MSGFEFDQVGKRMPYASNEFQAERVLENMFGEIKKRHVRRRNRTVGISLAAACVIAVFTFLLPNKETRVYNKVMRSQNLEETLKKANSDQLESWYCEDVDNI